ENRAREALRTVIDPEIGINIVDLGLVYGIEPDPAAPGALRVRMTLTSAACPMGASLVEEAGQALERALAGTVPFEIELTWEPPWEPSMMSPRAKQELGWEG